MLPITDRLPDLRSSDLAIDRSKPLPTSLQSDFLPEDVLFALTQPPQTKEPLGPASRFRNLNTSVVSISVIFRRWDTVCLKNQEFACLSLQQHFLYIICLFYPSL